MSSTELVNLDDVADVLLHGGEMAVVSEDAIQQDMVQRILNATSLEEAFAQFTSASAKDYEGVAMQIHGVAWLRSSFEDGPKVYALLKCVVNDTGEPVTLNMGGRSLMAAFLFAQRNAAMPFAGTFKREQSKTNPERKFWTFILLDPKKFKQHGELAAAR